MHHCLTLTKLYNYCIEEGTFPDILKIAEVKPIYKKGPKDICENYRLISLLSPFSKIFEKCIHHRLTQYLEKKKLLNVNQYRFRPNSSTSHAVSEICDNFFDNLDKGYTTCGLFLDLAKAFDTVDHNILSSKLAKYGIRGLPHQLLKSYLTNRKQYSVVNGKQSTVRNITCGVPQGSTLGPLLLIIYMNDLPLARNFRTRLFADDTSLTLSNSNIKQLEKDANTEVKKINDWMCLNKLSINYTKAEFLLITKKRNNVDFNITMSKLKLSAQIHGYRTRYSTQLNYFLPRKRIETGKRSFQFYGPKIWQEVPSDIKTHSFENFKVKYKRYLL